MTTRAGPVEIVAFLLAVVAGHPRSPRMGKGSPAIAAIAGL
jgi:hypothetical protein